MYIPKRVIVLMALMALVAFPMGAAQSVDRTIVGYGQHTEGPTKVLELPNGQPLVVGPLTATFAVGPDTALCAVGEAGGEPSPFNMLVYATDIVSTTYGTDDDGNPTFTLVGTVRSITTVGGVVLEDMLSPFDATASDGGGVRDDYFHISINTSLWPHTTFGRDLDGNPLPLFAGDVAIDKPVATGPGA